MSDCITIMYPFPTPSKGHCVHFLLCHIGPTSASLCATRTHSIRSMTLAPLSMNAETLSDSVTREKILRRLNLSYLIRFSSYRKAPVSRVLIPMQERPELFSGQ